MIVMGAHKGFITTGRLKIIHRFLPREVGTLLTYYLWLVLPFWEDIQANEWASLPSAVLNTGKVPLNRNGDGGALSSNPSPKKQSLKVKSLHRNIPYLGRHSFNAAGVPTFNLGKVNQLLVAKKIEGIKAPFSAPVGPEGTGAVDWLYLGNTGGSRGVSRVYRVLTAGGTSHGCKAKGMNSTSYTALYWF
ncbi:uncharacterized protein B0J16DRAFT_419334 [Fusarium flagelliforme]|uniref:Uncharacterized protein n=1 Tax=Fusarium flagelliforme TaxID=2675880 RepID=A0A395MJZ4_9HYPO|nr:uncharacterized protein B0J16DRAFT_419334 [Fusarium flagelliforme]KAH7169772.1 hypothetical protein B0J16DRAFT_419334 [Fusarium flagelliforme]RFN48264.1 hypothetical protein FIE12Z_7484 [Fusarium flagelliforme]